MNKAGGENGADAELLSDLARISLLSLITRDHRRRAHDERSHARKLSDHCVRERELIKTRPRIVTQIPEAKNREALFLLIGDGRERRLVNAMFGRRCQVWRGGWRLGPGDRFQPAHRARNGIRAPKITWWFVHRTLVTAGSCVNFLKHLAQLVAKVVHVLETILRFLRKCAIDNLIQTWRDGTRTQFGNRSRRIVQHRVTHVDRRFATEGPRAGEHFVKQNA